LIGRFVQRGDGVVNSPRQADKIRVKSAEYDSGVPVRPALMKPQKVSSIVCEQNPKFSGREDQHIGIRHCGIRTTRFTRGENIITQRAQLGHHLEGDVFITIETGHSI
jgi:hypothetical protein